MRALLKIGGSLMGDLSKVRHILDIAIASKGLLATTVGTGFPFKWHSESLRALGRRPEGQHRMELSAVCQEANEVTLTIADQRLVRVASLCELEQVPVHSVALLRSRYFLQHKLTTPLGADCKSLYLAEAISANTIILAKAISKVESSSITLVELRNQHPELLDHGFEEIWPKNVEVYIFSGEPVESMSLISQCVRVLR